MMVLVLWKWTLYSIYHVDCSGMATGNVISLNMVLLFFFTGPVLLPDLYLFVLCCAPGYFLKNGFHERIYCSLNFQFNPHVNHANCGIQCTFPIFIIIIYVLHSTCRRNVHKDTQSGSGTKMLHELKLQTLTPSKQELNLNVLKNEAYWNKTSSKGLLYYPVSSETPTAYAFPHTSPKTTTVVS